MKWSTWHSEFGSPGHFSLCLEKRCHRPLAAEVARFSCWMAAAICSSGVDMVTLVSLLARGATRRAQLLWIPTLDLSLTAATGRLLRFPLHRLDNSVSWELSAPRFFIVP